MKVAFILRDSVFKQKGGDTVQVVNTSQYLKQSGIEVDLHLTTDKINYDEYDLLHFFNIIRPADILHHIHRTDKPFVVSPVLVDYSEYDKFHRGGLAGKIFRYVSASRIEYMKAIARWLKGSDKMRSFSYLWQGHSASIKEILRKTRMVLPNSYMEYEKLEQLYNIDVPYAVVPYGADEKIFQSNNSVEQDANLVLCVGRIEGIKNQLNLIKALNNTEYQLLLIGAPAANQPGYHQQCRQIAGKNISFIEFLPHEELIKYYRKAKVHILPSWFETCGIVSLEAGAMGCNLVISNRGFSSEYFEDFVFYCDPASPDSIFQAVVNAAKSEKNKNLQSRILEKYTWEQAAIKTLEGYKQVLSVDD
jgi:glycosyltransferase involved in cell wall biosynthesis